MSSTTDQQSSTNVLPVEVPPKDLSRAEAPSALSANDTTNYEVVIVGAGMAGLAAAYHILLKRPATKLVIVESKDRVGGRIHSIPVDGKTIDLGASFIHGIQGNPIFNIVKKLDLPYRRTMTGIRVIRPDGSVFGPDLTARVGQKIFGTMFGWLIGEAQGGEDAGSVPSERDNIKDRILGESSPIYHGEENVGAREDTSVDKEVENPKEEVIRISEWFVRACQGWTGAPLDYVSLKWWGFGQDTEGEDVALLDGYAPIVTWLVTEITRLGGRINTSEKIAAVVVDEEEGITLKNSHADGSADNSEAVGKEYKATYALLTLPLGVLKQSPPSFEPPLPYRRQQAINRMGMGLLDKIVVIYDHAWWVQGDAFVREDEGTLSHILLPDKSDLTRLLGPSKGLFPSSGSPPPGSFPPRTASYLRNNPQCLMMYDMHAQNGVPALCIFMPGEFGDVVECCSEEETKEWANAVIRDWLGKAIHNNVFKGKANAMTIPDPIRIVRTNWRKDPDAFGSYSYIPVGVEGEEAASPTDQLELGRTLWDRVFWAGEHTEVNQFASVHGAWKSGVREAEKILVYLDAQEEAQEE